MRIIMGLPLIVFFAVSCSSSSNLAMPGANEKFDDPPEPGFSAVSVHDPSIFVSGESEYYAIGSHLAAAKTAVDMIRERGSDSGQGIVLPSKLIIRDTVSKPPNVKKSHPATGEASSEQ